VAVPEDHDAVFVLVGAAGVPVGVVKVIHDSGSGRNGGVELVEGECEVVPDRAVGIYVLRERGLGGSDLVSDAAFGEIGVGDAKVLLVFRAEVGELLPERATFLGAAEVVKAVIEQAELQAEGLVLKEEQGGLGLHVE
jgi:hypothetical protein